MQTTPFVVNVCPTGMVAGKAHNPSLPVTPEEIAEDVERCARLGASMFHLHARDELEEPEWRTERFSEILGAVRTRCPDVILCVTTSGRKVQDLERRAAALDAVPAPDMGSLTLSSLNFMRQGSLNEPEVVKGLAAAMYDRGIVPELEIFDVGMARFARHLIDTGVLRPPYYINVLLGNVATAGCDPLDLAAITKELPAGATWCVAGIGASQLPANTLGILFGDGVRVGLEDNLYLQGKELASNVELVERVIELGRLLGRQPLSPAELRERIGLRSPVVAR